MIRVKCPKCSRALAVDDSKAGVAVRCPGCQAAFRIPTPKTAGPNKPGPVQPKGAKGQTTQPKPPDNSAKKPTPPADDFDPYVMQDALEQPKPKTRAVMDDLEDEGGGRKKKTKKKKKPASSGGGSGALKILVVLVCLGLLVGAGILIYAKMEGVEVDAPVATAPEQ